jgi:hypothetical protein
MNDATRRSHDAPQEPNVGTRLLGLEALRGPLAHASQGAIDGELLNRLERARAEHLDRRMFACVSYRRARHGAVEVQVAMLDVGAAGEQPRQLPGVITLGRHDRCDFGELGGAALRHALLLAYPPSEGEPARIEALDLASGIGLGVGLGRGSTQLLAARRMRFGVGDCGVLAFLAEPGERLFPEGVEAALASLDKGAHVAGVNLHMPADEREEAPPTEALRHLGANADSMWSEGSQIEPCTLVASVEPDAYVIEARPAELQGGLLLGRYPRCRGSLELGQDGSVSRVHAVIVRRRGQSFLIDCGSTNGTSLDAASEPLVELGPDQRIAAITPGDDVLLGGLRLRFTLVAEAEA